MVNGENLQRCAEKTDVALGHLVFESCAYVLEICSPSPWGSGHDMLVNRNFQKKSTINNLPSKFPLIKLPGTLPQTESFSSDVTHWCMFEQPFSLCFRFFSDSEVGRGQGPPKTVIISKSPMPGMRTFLFLTEDWFLIHSHSSYDTIALPLEVLMSSLSVRSSILSARRYR